MESWCLCDKARYGKSLWPGEVDLFEEYYAETWLCQSLGLTLSCIVLKQWVSGSVWMGISQSLLSLQEVLGKVIRSCLIYFLFVLRAYRVCSSSLALSPCQEGFVWEFMPHGFLISCSRMIAWFSHKLQLEELKGYMISWTRTTSEVLGRWWTDWNRLSFSAPIAVMTWESKFGKALIFLLKL